MVMPPPDFLQGYLTLGEVGFGETIGQCRLGPCFKSFFLIFLEGFDLIRSKPKQNEQDDQDDQYDQADQDDQDDQEDQEKKENR